jgi:hypothetical protein
VDAESRQAVSEAERLAVREVEFQLLHRDYIVWIFDLHALAADYRRMGAGDGVGGVAGGAIQEVSIAWRRLLAGVCSIPGPLVRGTRGTRLAASLAERFKK